MNHCVKRQYANEAEAEIACRNLKRTIRNHGQGKDWRSLSAYLCRKCETWHVGRDGKTAARHARQYEPKPAAEPKPPSRGDMLRKLNRMAEQWQRRDDYLLKQRAEALGRMIQADKDWLKAQADLERCAARHDEALRQIEMYFLQGTTRE